MWFYYGMSNDLAVGLDMEVGNYEQALKRVTDEYELGKKNGDVQLIGIALGGMGHAYHCMGQFDQSLAAFREAENVPLKDDDRQMAVTSPLSP